MTSFQESGQITEAGSNNTSVLFAPKRPLLAVGDRSGVIKLIDAVKRGEPRKLVWRQPAPVHPVKFTKDGRFLLGLVRVPPADHCAVWAVDSGKEVVAWSLPLDIISVDLSPDGRVALGGSQGGTVRVWDTSTALELVR